jgi:hypothetical protein
VAPERVEAITVRFEGVAGEIVVSNRALTRETVQDHFDGLSDAEKWELITSGDVPHKLDASVKEVMCNQA